MARVLLLLALEKGDALLELGQSPLDSGLPGAGGLLGGHQERFASSSMTS